ncbi:MAG: hypothetical protein NVS3B28_23250 [Candidatus Velthaea sp.]
MIWFHSMLRHGERGQTLPIVALMFTVFLGFSALAIDVGNWRYQQRIEQTAADSASVAGAIELNYSRVASVVTTVARADAALNGFTDNGTNVTVTVNNPPLTGPLTGNTNAVEVIVAKKHLGFFTGIFGQNFQWVVARAVTSQSLVGRACIYTLNGDISITGGGTISAQSCGLSTDNNLNISSNATVNANTIGYVGSWSGVGTYPNGQPEKTVSVQDPCQTIVGCNYLSANPPPLSPCADVSPIPATLLPGEYCSVLNIATTVTFSPGLYVFDQGFAASGGAVISGTGVTLYNKSSTFTSSGTASIILSAPSTGNMEGMVFYQPASNSNPFTLNGSSGTYDFTGGMYMPTAAMTMNASVPHTTLLVAGSISMNGGGIGATATGLPGVGHVVMGE